MYKFWSDSSFLKCLEKHTRVNQEMNMTKLITNSMIPNRNQIKQFLTPKATV